MTTTKSIKSVLLEEAGTPEVEVSSKQLVDEGIARVIEATGIDVQKSRYKAQRAIAWQAFIEAIEAGDFDGLITRAIANVGSLPSGWEIEVASKAVEATAPAKKAATAAKPATR